MKIARSKDRWRDKRLGKDRTEIKADLGYYLFYINRGPFLTKGRLTLLRGLHNKPPDLAGPVMQCNALKEF
jgi:hypothetical protein